MFNKNAHRSVFFIPFPKKYISTIKMSIGTLILLTRSNLYVLPLALFFIFVLLPLTPIFSYDYHNHQRIWQITLLTIISCVMLFKFSINKSTLVFIEKKTLFLLFLLLAFGTLSAVLSNEPTFSLMYVIHFYFLVTLLIYSSQIHFKNATLLFIYFLVASHSALLLICFLNIIFSLAENTAPNVYVVYSGFINIRFFNHLQVFILPLLLLLMRIPNIQKVIFFMIGLNVYLLFLGQARGAMISWFGMLMFVYLTNINLKKQCRTALIISVIALLIFVFLELILKADITTIRTSSSGRITMWLGTLSQLNWLHFLFGNGPGIFGFRLSDRGPFSHPHNFYIEILNEWGGVALFTLLYLITSTIIKTLKHIQSHQNDIITASLFYSWLSGCVYSLFSGVIVMPVPQTLFFILWGLIFARIKNKTNVPPIKTFAMKVFVVLVFVVLLTYYLQNSYDFYHLINPDEGYTHGPRFWSVGKRA